MSIIRIKKEREYVSIANAILQDKSLSWEARGIMAYLLSKPDGWQCRNYDLMNQGPTGEHAIKRILKELRDAGYIHRFKVSGGRGKIEWVTEIYETPELNPHFTTVDNTTVDNTTVDNTTVDNIEVVKSDDIVSTDSQKVLTTESTDISGTPQNSQANGKDGFDRADQVERVFLNALAGKVATFTKTDIDTAGPKTREALKDLTIALSQKPNIEIKLPACEKWWYANDWRGKQGQPPTVWQLGDIWGQFEADKVAPPPSSGPTLTDAEKMRLAELVAENQP